MTGTTRWIAWHLPLSCILMSAGCGSTPVAGTPGEGRAVLADARIAGSSTTASALEQLEKSSSTAANTVRAIAAARDVTVNNISNAQTQAFKQSHVILQGGGAIYVQLDLSQGSLQNTGGNLDVAIEGLGFLPVKIKSSLGGTGYTRAGNFTTNNEGDLVVGIGDGYKLVPPITLPTNATNISIASDGTVQYVKAGQTVKSTAGQIKLAIFPNPQGLALLGGSIYQQTEASGPAVTSVPGEDGTGQIISGFLESSNVDLIVEMVRLHELDEWRAALLEALGVYIQSLPSSRTDVPIPVHQALGVHIQSIPSSPDFRP